MGWLTALLGGLATAAKWAFSFWMDKKAQQHDEGVMRQQQTEDALKGESDAIKQVDRVAAATDAPDGGMQYDPENLTR